MSDIKRNSVFCWSLQFTAQAYYCLSAALRLTVAPVLGPRLGKLKQVWDSAPDCHYRHLTGLSAAIYMMCDFLPSWWIWMLSPHSRIDCSILAWLPKGKVHGKAFNNLEISKEGSRKCVCFIFLFRLFLHISVLLLLLVALCQLSFFCCFVLFRFSFLSPQWISLLCGMSLSLSHVCLFLLPAPNFGPSLSFLPSL